MSDNQDDFQEKTEDPTAYKLEKSREKGQVSFSKDLTSFLLVSAVMITLYISTASMVSTLLDFLSHIYSQKLTNLLYFI